MFVSALIGGAFQTPAAGRRGARRRFLAAGDRGRQRRRAAGRVHQRRTAVRGGPREHHRARSARRTRSPAGASNPSLEMTNFGKAYLAFTVADGAGHDVRAAYYVGGHVGARVGAAQRHPRRRRRHRHGRAGGRRPPATASAIVAWGEGGHVYSRRVWGTAPSVVDEQADVPSVSGCGEVSAGEPAVGGRRRLLLCRRGLPGGRLVRRRPADAGADEPARGFAVRRRRRGRRALEPGRGRRRSSPQVAMTEYGAGVRHLGRANLERRRRDGARQQRRARHRAPDQQPARAAAARMPVPAIAGLFSDLIAWQQTRRGRAREIRVRYEPRASTLGARARRVLAGPGADRRGARAGGRRRRRRRRAPSPGSRGPAPRREIVVDQLYQPPGSAAAGEVAVLLADRPAGAQLVAGERRLGADHLHGDVDGLAVGADRADAPRSGRAAPRRRAHAGRSPPSNPAGLTDARRRSRDGVRGHGRARCSR